MRICLRSSVTNIPHSLILGKREVQKNNDFETFAPKYLGSPMNFISHRNLIIFHHSRLYL